MTKRLVVALVLAVVAGVLNFVYLSGARYEYVLMYTRDISANDPVQSSDLETVAFSFPKNSTEEQKGAFTSTFRGTDDRTFLEGARLTRNVKRGELARKSDTDPGMCDPPDIRVFGKFKVIEASDNSVTMLPDPLLDPDWEDSIKRLLEISGKSQDAKSSYKILGVVQYPLETAAKADSSTEPGKNDDVSMPGVDQVEGSSQSSGGSGAASPAEMRKFTIPLPKGLIVPSSFGYEETYVGFLVKASLLSSDELKRWKLTPDDLKNGK